MRPRADRSARARSLSRKLAMQALYQWQLAGQSASELQRQFAAEEGYGDAEEEYFAGLVNGVTTTVAVLDTRLQPLIDRPLAQLDRSSERCSGSACLSCCIDLTCPTVS
jgi:N utilization substance protein B